MLSDLLRNTSMFETFVPKCSIHVVSDKKIIKFKNCNSIRFRNCFHERHLLVQTVLPTTQQQEQEQKQEQEHTNLQ